MNEKSRELFIIAGQNQSLISFSLEDIPEGQKQVEINPNLGKFDFWIEGVHQEWCLRCGENTWIEVANSSGIYQYKFIKLPKKAQFDICEENGKRLTVYVYPGNTSHVPCSHYSIEQFSTIHVGRSDSCQIQVFNPLVSREHFIIEQYNGNLRMVDQKSGVGTLLNQEKTHSSILQVGDCIEIPGLTICIGIGFLSIKANPHLYKVKNLPKIMDPKGLHTSKSPEIPESIFPFVRRPRIRSFHCSTKKIEVEAPPMPIMGDKIPLALRMGGSMVYSGMSALSGNFTSMISSVLFPVLTSKYTDKQKAEYEERRTRRYMGYLNQKYNEIEQTIRDEKRELEENNPSPSELHKMMTSRLRLWERRPTDLDFLSLRIGVSNQSLKSEIKFPPRSFGIDEDPLQEKMFQLCENPYVIEKAPVAINLIEQFVLGVKGTSQDREELFLSLLCELCYLHDPEEVRVVILAPEDFLHKYPEILYLPHVWNEDDDFRFIATNPSECSLISRELFKSIEWAKDRKASREALLKHLPYTVVFSFSDYLLDSVTALKEVLMEDANLGVSIVAFSDLLPNACKQLLDLLERPRPVLLQLQHQEEKDIFFEMDITKVDTMRNLLSSVSNIPSQAKSKKEALPGMLTFLEMYQKSKIEQFALLQRWRNSNPIKSLSVPVGINPDGSLFTLDAHEKFQGPHGLIAGMTGSGKSEFIITYILSLALNYHPYEVSFILIDFKGGGLTGAFENKLKGTRLPHLAGTITNLDESTMTRALISIESELKRRQAIFNEAKAIVNEGTMDIYGYQKLYRNGLVKEPVSHLFIISDEFAELKSQKPEFMDQLISTARIGRSLGVHLILATQKPGGIVTDQIWSNTRFRVCLKVQDRIDSMDMIKRPEAAELKETGRFYLQVGYNEYFALGQSAWSGAPYEPSETIQVKEDDEIVFVDPTGQTIFSAKPLGENKDNTIPQLVAIMEHLSNTAKEYGIESRKLWLDPLPKEIDFEDLKRPTKEYQAILGIIDNPTRQEQFPFVVDLNKTRNLLIAGESGSGKSTLLQTLLVSLIQNHSPNTLQIYLADLPGKTMGVFLESNFFGSVLLRPDDIELGKLVDLILEILQERKDQFMAWKISQFEEAKEEKEIPLILFVLDGFDEIPDDSKGREIQDKLITIAREGPSYGIQFIFTIANIRNLMSRLRNEIGFYLPLHLKESFNYIDLLGKRPSFVPEDLPGRGLVLFDQKIVEFQTAQLCVGQNNQIRNKALESKVKQLNLQHLQAKKPRKLLTLDRKQTYEDFIKQFKIERLPIGLNVAPIKPVAIPFQQFHLLGIYFGQEECRPLFLKNIQIASLHNQALLAQVSVHSNSFQSLNSDQIFDLSKEEESQKFLEWMKSIIIERTAIRKQICVDLDIELTQWKEKENIRRWRKEMRKKTQPIFIFIESLVDLAVNLTGPQMATFKTYLSNCDGFNFYILAGFYWNDTEKINRAEDKFKSSEENQTSLGPRYNFNELQDLWREKTNLLLGGRFDKQNIVSLPMDLELNSSLSSPNLNQAIFSHHNKIIKVLVPMGDLTQNSIEDEDEMPFL